MFEAGRDAAAEWLGWEAPATILTRNATEAINLVAFTWGRANVGAGDRVVVTGMEHHSNFVPWWMLCREVGATLEVVPVDANGELVLEELDAMLAGGDVRVVAVAHVSNVLGTINPVAESCAGHVRRRDHGHRWGPGRAADSSRPAGDRSRLLRLDRSQGLRTDGTRRPPRSSRAARGHAAVARRRSHDRVGDVGRG